jgi:hypothetical protein
MPSGQEFNTLQVQQVNEDAVKPIWQTMMKYISADTLHEYQASSQTTEMQTQLSNAHKHLNVSSDINFMLCVQ